VVSSITPAGTITADGLSVPVTDVRAVEERASRAWPETQHEMIGGWRLRYSPGVPNRRANSVLPIFSPEGANVEKCVEKVEAYYRERKMPARFMISPPSEPTDLDQFLSDRGYHIDAPTDVQWADAAGLSRLSGDGLQVEFDQNPTMDWMSVYMEGVSDAAEIGKKRDLISRIGAPFTLAQVRVGGKVASVGLGVSEDGWVGIFCMHTLTDFRRQGLARAVLGGLVRWGQDMGGAQMYLQVERDNPGARQFYESAGFTTCYGYHYRTKDVG